MARVNQGAYTKIINKFKAIKSEYEKFLEDYYDENDMYTGNDLFSSYYYSADDLYIASAKLKQEIDVILETQKFEEEETLIKYQKMSSELDMIYEDVLDRVKDIYQMTHTDYNFKEVGYVNNYSVLRAIMY